MQWGREQGDVLRAVRESRGWSRRRVEIESGVSESTIFDLENGQRRSGDEVNPRADTLRALDRALGDERLTRVIDGMIGEGAPMRRSVSYGGRPLSEEEETDVLEYIEWVQSRG